MTGDISGGTTTSEHIRHHTTAVEGGGDEDEALPNPDIDLTTSDDLQSRIEELQKQIDILKVVVVVVVVWCWCCRNIGGAVCGYNNAVTIDELQDTLELKVG